MPDTKRPPFFSIVIPTLNEENYLPHLLQDLQEQTWQEFEVFVVDGGSEDTTVAKAKEFAQVTVLHSPQKNVSLQRNLGGQKATGEYIVFLDADTRIPANFLADLYQQLTSKSTDVCTVWISGYGLKNTDKGFVLLANLILESTQWTDRPSAFGAMIACKREWFTRIGGFDENITFAEDMEIVERLIREGARFRVLREPRYSFSLRRFQKEGTLPLIEKATRLHLKILLHGYPREEQELYPMLGGQYYDEKETEVTEASETQPATRRLLLTLKRSVKNLRERADLNNLLERFFED